MDFHVVIPARLNSSRLPGKVLLDLAGKPVIQYVYENAIQSGAESVVVATDDAQIAEVAEGFGATVCMTASDHQSGTERISEAVEALELDASDVIIGLQADEPLLPHNLIRLLAEDLIEHDNVKIASLCAPINTTEELFNPNVVKVVLNKRNYAMYFSRSSMPWDRDSFADKSSAKLSAQHYKHIGVYGYRACFLQDYLGWSACPLESIEHLEQLRILWNGGRIHMNVCKTTIPPGIDTEEDYVAVSKLMKKSKSASAS
jgi:3-deoxy-manno-octulosonate cytidylyltransferase (CMP-KDO synthetase)